MCICALGWADYSHSDHGRWRATDDEDTVRPKPIKGVDFLVCIVGAKTYTETVSYLAVHKFTHTTLKIEMV